MKNTKLIKATLLPIALSIGLSSISFFGHATQKSVVFEPHVEHKLVKVCEALQSNNRFELRSAIKSTGLSNKSIAEGLVCNGMDSVTFALSVNATNTASYLAQRSDLKYNELMSKTQ